MLKDASPAAQGGGGNGPVPATAEEENGASFAAQLSGGGGEFIVPAEGKKKISAGMIMFLGVAAVAGGSLWWMHQRTGGPSPAQAADPTVDAARASIQQFLSADAKGGVREMKQMLADSSQITDKFATYNEDRQVPLDSLKTNPFYFEHGEDEAAPDAGVELSRRQQEELARKDAERLRLAEEAARKEQDRVAAEAAKLQLTTVFYGRSPTAMINGRICRVGQQVGEFTVTAIRPNAVEVRHGEHTFELQINAQ